VLCDKITVIVNGQSKQHGKRLEISACKVGEGKSKEDIKSAKLASHGIVARDKNGKLVVAVEGHNYGKAKVVEVVNKLLEAK
tara:strand:- start:52 stop:297 length:246 start_codon:yes stop_codon:yes gene_type:complete